MGFDYFIMLSFHPQCALDINHLVFKVHQMTRIMDAMVDFMDK